ncbi:nitric oxide reductase activation protein NorD [Tianweitania sp.]|uniref:nitric oxide reductase activation protein NorD n=1 Tax=Tianweitania sp. TaxID=2021634 RepID=UPI00289BCCAC|nr:VWA domain-containing protein [Tianweitania sp.]
MGFWTFEPEETVGRYWHRLVGASTTYRAYPDARVSLDEMRERLGLLFRALGGSGAIRLAATAHSESNHRLNMRQALGLGKEVMERPTLDLNTLRLPGAIDVFPNRADNIALYEWLAGWFAHAVAPGPATGNLLHDDIERLHAAALTTQATLAAWPGLRATYAQLCQATLAVRSKRHLPQLEAKLEQAIIGALVQGVDLSPRIWRDNALLEGSGLTSAYRTYLPVPLWGEVTRDEESPAAGDEDEAGGDGMQVDSRRRKAVRKSSDKSDRGDPLILHRFETIFSLADMINVNRSVEDDDEEGARQAAEDTPELTIGANSKRAATRLKLDLDLAPRQADTTTLAEDCTYPEWNWKQGRYLKDYCRVHAIPAQEEGEDWSPDADMQRTIRDVRRRFEALRPRRQTFHAQPDGDELDLGMVVRDIADRSAGGAGTERVFLQARAAMRDLSLAVLMDVSLSTDAYIQERRVLDVEKSALLALTHGLTACGDEHAIFTFTSRRRQNVTVATVKGFSEKLDARVIRRIEALKPGQYTRIGAAIRHVSKQLEKRPFKHRLLLLLTDGKPNDVDHYEGRYGIEDTRHAIWEARKLGLRVFGVTVDENARDYVPHIFGPGGYAIVKDIARLPAALPAIYRQITS